MISMSNKAMAGLNLAKTKGFILASGILGVCALLCLALAEKVQAENPQNGNPFTLAGSWTMVVGAPPGPTFTAYETFTEGGGSVEINNGPGGSTTGIGTWMRIGHRRFLATLFKQQFDDAGNFQATLKVRRLIILSSHGDEFVGTDNVDVFDPAGNLVFSPPPGSFRGTRLAAEPVDRNP